MSSHVVFRYRLAPQGDISPALQQLPAPQTADIAEVHEQKKAQMWEAPQPIQWVTTAFLVGLTGVLLYGVYLRFAQGLI